MDIKKLKEITEMTYQEKLEEFIKYVNKWSEETLTDQLKIWRD